MNYIRLPKGLSEDTFVPDITYAKIHYKDTKMENGMPTNVDRCTRSLLNNSISCRCLDNC